MKKKIVILTPLKKEYLAVREYLKKIKTIIGLPCNLCESGRLRNTSNENHKIILVEIGMNITNAAIVTAEIVQKFKPALVILEGIAGGVKDVSIGDLVIGTKAYGYEFGKEENGQFLSRPEVGYYSEPLINVAKEMAHQQFWIEKLARNIKKPKVIFAPIASGNKLVASTNQQTYNLVASNFNDTVAVDMEGIGVLIALRKSETPCLHIRCISDMLDNKHKTDKEGCQELAAKLAAVFTISWIHHYLKKAETMGKKKKAKKKNKGVAKKEKKNKVTTKVKTKKSSGVITIGNAEGGININSNCGDIE